MFKIMKHNFSIFRNMFIVFLMVFDFLKRQLIFYNLFLCI